MLLREEGVVAFKNMLWGWGQYRNVEKLPKNTS